MTQDERLPLLLRPAEVGQQIGTSEKTVYRMIAAGRLRAVTVGMGGGRVRVPREALEEYIASLGARGGLTASGDEHETGADPMKATRAVAEFLRHLRARDVPDAELFDLKAQAFDLMADLYTRDGDEAKAAECRATAVEARGMSLES